MSGTDPIGNAVIVRSRSVVRDFSGVRALDQIDLEIRRGTFHALVGQNGAGKSTFLGIIAGRLKPSSGEVELKGALLPYGSPRGIRQAGLAAIYQELTVIPTLTAVANVFLGHPTARYGFLAERSMRKTFRKLCARLDVVIDPDVVAGALSVADQQMLEIMRALLLEPDVILLDEPTASLSVNERQSLYRILNELRSNGITLVLVSHNLDEVLDMSDQITVFRDGRIARDARRSEWDKRSLVRAMLGDVGTEVARDIMAEQIDPTSAVIEPNPELTDEALTLTGLNVPGVLRDVSIDVRLGEIVGIGGLVGSGRTTILRAIAGLEPTASGSVRIRGVEQGIPRNVRQARKLGIGLLPEERKREGLVLGLSAAENVMLGSRKAGRFGFVSPRSLRRAAHDLARESGFNTARLDEMTRNFSGGNQQKLLLARSAGAGLTILLADEPTRGIDVHAKEEIYEQLRRSAAEGMAVVVVSSELEEITALSDRAFVLARGTCVAELHRASGELTVARILEHAFDVEEN